jgi:DNA primase large subunit
VDLALAFYPFLPEARQAVRATGPPIDALLSSPLYAGVRARAVARVAGALGGGIPPADLRDGRDAVLELCSVPLARMLVVAANEKPLVSRYAAAESETVRAALAGDGPDALRRAATALDVEMRLDTDGGDAEGGVELHVADYLRHAPSGKEWKLVLQTVDRGRLRLPVARAVELLAHAVERRIVAELDAERGRPMPDDLRDGLAPLLEELAPKLDEAKASWSEGDFGPVQPGLFPPCMKELFEGMKRGENTPHHGRFAFVTFLHTVGWNVDQIIGYLSQTPNFSPDKSRYQIEHITGQKGVSAYTPPGCATMQTNGVCPLDKRDGLCFKIKHPLSYYRAKLRFQKNDAAAQPTTPKPAAESAESTEARRPTASEDSVDSAARGPS